MKQQISPFNIIGISVRTRNGDVEQLTRDMQGLWSRFLSENLLNRIQNKLSNSIYCVYTDYESDHNGDYTAFLGAQVESLDQIPNGLEGKQFAGGEYQKHTAKGNLNDGIVYNVWTKIWNSEIPRAYSADFEVYAEKAHNPLDAEVDIFVAIK